MELFENKRAAMKGKYFFNPIFLLSVVKIEKEEKSFLWKFFCVLESLQTNWNSGADVN